LVQLKKAPEVIFRETPAMERLESNQLIFHIQPDQEIEVRFQAKHPGPSMKLQKVNMRFDYREASQAARATGYEVLPSHCLLGDAMLFSRTDLVESAWKIAQPILDVWAASPAEDFPNYPAGSWGPKAATIPRGSSGSPDRKSTRLNSSHVSISYAVFCLKKKKNKPNYTNQ